MSATSSQRAVTASGSLSANTDRNAAETISWCALDRGEQVAGVVDAASLPGGAGHGLADRGAQPGVGVGDHEADTAQPPGAQRPQESGPERLVFAVADVHAEHFAFTGRGDRGGDHDGAGHDLAQGVVADMDVGGIQVHVRERDVAECAVAERSDPFVEPGADATDF